VVSFWALDKVSLGSDQLYHERVIGMRLEQLQRIARSVGIAGGPRKLQAIRSALVGRWINVLITDRFTAESLVRKAGTPQAPPLEIASLKREE
jgi:DNA-binding transcriptional regulator LsrR (DeoR family)